MGQSIGQSLIRRKGWTETLSSRKLGADRHSAGPSRFHFGSAQTGEAKVSASATRGVPTEIRPFSPRRQAVRMEKD